MTLGEGNTANDLCRFVTALSNDIGKKRADFERKGKKEPKIQLSLKKEKKNQSTPSQRTKERIDF